MTCRTITEWFNFIIRGYHAHVVNSRALELAGITKDTPDPEGGVIDKDPTTGEPTGVLRDTPFMKEVTPKATLEDFKAGLARISEAYVKIGVTSTGEAGTNRLTWLQTLGEFLAIQ